ncbi:hypothetical protein Ancab_032120 [Ancistrocladus abbreviatus]
MADEFRRARSSQSQGKKRETKLKLPLSFLLCSGHGSAHSCCHCSSIAAAQRSGEEREEWFFIEAKEGDRKGEEGVGWGGRRRVEVEGEVGRGGGWRRLVDGGAGGSVWVGVWGRGF